MKPLTSRVVLLLLTTFVILHACSKGGESAGPDTPPDPCTGITITVAGAVSPAFTGQSNGSINASATGTTGAFTYKLNSGSFQSSGTFTGLAKGSYTITAKSAGGCTGTKSFTITETSACTGTAGPKFTAVKDLVAAKCLTACHSGATPTGNLNLSIECNIVLNKDNINNRAIITGDMPQTGPLTTAEKKIITDWIAAGGKYTD
jgi:hypothetical protein